MARARAYDLWDAIFPRVGHNSNVIFEITKVFLVEPCVQFSKVSEPVVYAVDYELPLLDTAFALGFLQLPPIDKFVVQHFKYLEPDFSLVGVLSEWLFVTF